MIYNLLSFLKISMPLHLKSKEPGTRPKLLRPDGIFPAGLFVIFSSYALLDTFPSLKNAGIIFQNEKTKEYPAVLCPRDALFHICLSFLSMKRSVGVG
jgi:hypothetical protein